MLPKEIKLFQFFPVSRTSENLSTASHPRFHHMLGLFLISTHSCWSEASCCALQGKGQQTKENSSLQLHHLTAPLLQLHQLMIT